MPYGFFYVNLFLGIFSLFLTQFQEILFNLSYNFGWGEKKTQSFLNQHSPAVPSPVRRNQAGFMGIRA